MKHFKTRPMGIQLCNLIINIQKHYVSIHLNNAGIQAKKKNYFPTEQCMCGSHMEFTNNSRSSMFRSRLSVFFLVVPLSNAWHTHTHTTEYINTHILLSLPVQFISDVMFNVFFSLLRLCFVSSENKIVFQFPTTKPGEWILW